jgi:secreted PhoX family phosphatase
VRQQRVHLAERDVSGMTEDDAGKAMTREQVDLGMAAMGHSIAEVMLKDGKWAIVEDSPLNRRITANTEMLVSGPAAGHALMKTSADASPALQCSAPATIAAAASPPGARC